MADDYNAPLEGQSSYTEGEAQRLFAEEAKYKRMKAAPKCTCKGSPFGMDIDLCPVHGKGCA